MLTINLDDATHLATALRDENLCVFMTTDIRAESDGKHGTALSVDPLGADEDTWLELRVHRVMSPKAGVDLTRSQRRLFDFMNQHPCIVASEDTPTPDWAMLEPLDIAGIRAMGVTHCIFATPETYAEDAEAIQPGSTADHGDVT